MEFFTVHEDNNFNLRVVECEIAVMQVQSQLKLTSNKTGFHSFLFLIN